MQNNLSITLQQLDVNGQTTTRRVYTISDTAPTSGEFLSGIAPDNAQHAITLPITQPRQVFVKNTHASAKLTVVWTPFGGAEVTVTTIGPGGFIGLWDPTAAVSGIGISTLKLTSDTTGGTYEVFVGG